MEFLILFLFCFIITGILCASYWIPRHIFFIHFSVTGKKSTDSSSNIITFIPGQEKPLPKAYCPIKKGNYTWKTMSPSIFSLENGKITAKRTGTGILFCHKRYRRKWAFGLLKIRVNEKPVFFRHTLLVHALGGMEKQYTYCNCLEGLEQSLARKSPFIETDMILTSDGELVCSHGWKKKTYTLTGVPFPTGNAVMSYDTFMNTKIQGKFTTIDARKIVDTMKKYPKILVELDLRTLNRKTAKRTCEKIVEVFEHRDDLLHRLLIQVGSPDMYAGIDNVYHFPYYQYFIHKDEAANPQPVIDFCVKKGIISAAIKDTYFSPELQSLCHRNGICVLVYTVDDPQAAKNFLASGADTICSNFLTPEELP